MNKRVIHLVFIMMLSVAGTIAMAQQDLLGTWSGQDNYGGTATIVYNPDGTYQFTYVNPQGMTQESAGAYTVGINEVTFLVYPSGDMQTLRFTMAGKDAMTLKIGETVFNLNRMNKIPDSQRGGVFGNPTNNQPQPTNPNRNPNMQPPPNQNGNLGQNTVPNTPGGFVQHQHPQGFTLSAPGDWQKTLNQNALILIPADAYQTQQGPAEAAFVYAEPNGGLTDPMSPQVENFLKNQVSQVFPYLQPAGKRQTQIGAVYEYQGRSPLGINMTGRLFLKMEGSLGLICFGVTPSEKIDQRSQVFYAINDSSTQGGGGQQAMPQNQPNSFPQNQMPQNQPNNFPQNQPNNFPQNQMPQQGPQGNQQGSINQNLVGFWYYQEQRNWQGAGSTTLLEGIDLRPDGTFSILQKYDYQGQNAPGQQGRWQEISRGNWTAQGNQIMLSAQGQTLNWSYQMTGNGVTFTDQNGKVYNCQRGQYQ